MSTDRSPTGVRRLSVRLKKLPNWTDYQVMPQRRSRRTSCATLLSSDGSVCDSELTATVKRQSPCIVRISKRHDSPQSRCNNVNLRLSPGKTHRQSLESPSEFHECRMKSPTKLCLVLSPSKRRHSSDSKATEDDVKENILESVMACAGTIGASKCSVVTANNCVQEDAKLNSTDSLNCYKNLSECAENCGKDDVSSSTNRRLSMRLRRATPKMKEWEMKCSNLETLKVAVSQKSITQFFRSTQEKSTDGLDASVKTEKSYTSQDYMDVDESNEMDYSYMNGECSKPETDEEIEDAENQPLPKHNVCSLEERRSRRERRMTSKMEGFWKTSTAQRSRGCNDRADGATSKSECSLLVQASELNANRSDKDMCNGPSLDKSDLLLDSDIGTTHRQFRNAALRLKSVDKLAPCTTSLPQRSGPTTRGRIQTDCDTDRSCGNKTLSDEEQCDVDMQHKEDASQTGVAERRFSGRCRKVPSAMQGFVLGSGRKLRNDKDDERELQEVKYSMNVIRC